LSHPSRRGLASGSQPIGLFLRAPALLVGVSSPGSSTAASSRLNEPSGAMRHCESTILNRGDGV
jgi:hypothetical protein